MKNNCKNTHQKAILPSKGVMFLGCMYKGVCPNLLKKLQQVYLKWDFISDEQLQRKISFKQDTIFYWTGHGSHQLMEYVYSRASKHAKVLYVTSTNLPLLLSEMSAAYYAATTNR